MNDEEGKTSGLLPREYLCAIQRRHELRRPRNHDIAAKQAQADERGRSSAEQLRDPVADRVRPCHVSAADETKGDGGIQLAPEMCIVAETNAAIVSPCASATARTSCPAVLGRANPDEDERKGSNKFRDAGSKLCHAVMEAKNTHE